ncbi:MAG: tRNA uridine-5-carboxymethylaminomethyl(34) synthesis GTPase MnmE [Thermodesulfobacteriota bacterium]
MPDDFSPADTIAALSTPPGQAGIGIIRMSGPQSVTIARAVFRPRHPIPEWKSHRLHLGDIVDPVTRASVDEVLLSTMKAPHSYTREDVVEINSHSGHALHERILNILLDAGARQARPGEFTLRAFLNGRIDLTQAEAVMDLISAQSERGVELASRQLKGGLKDRIEAVRGSLIGLIAHAEVAIDYPEEGYGLISGEEASGRLTTDVLMPLEEIRAAHARRRIWVEGTKVALVGRVNVGKSSILNRLVGGERAIVSSEPGTTRDVIEQGVQINGLPLRILDTAGYREAKGEVESLGIRLTERCIEEADLALWVVDQSRRLDVDDHRILDRCKKVPTLAVVNKIDLPGLLNEEELGKLCGDIPVIRVSALSGDGMAGLEKAVRNAVLGKDKARSDAEFAPNARQNRVLGEACAHLRRAASHLRKDAPLEIVVLDLGSGLDRLDELTGRHTADDVLERIFSEFCLGK